MTKPSILDSEKLLGLHLPDHIKNQPGVPRRSPPRLSIKYIVSLLGSFAAIAYFGWFCLGLHSEVPPPARPATSREAYVLFLPSLNRLDDLLGIRVLLYGYKHDPDTRDPERDVIVLTTPQVPLETEDLLRSEGAIIFRHELITSIPNPIDPASTHPYKDQYNKLLIWNMTQYERLLLADADMLMAGSLRGIWDEPAAQATTGLAARFMLHSGLGEGYLNSGFIIARPNRTMFEELLLVRDFVGPLTDIEQSLLNKYFHHDGPHPWMTLDGKWVKTAPTKEDLEDGIHMLHEKFWLDDRPRELVSAWRTKLGKMLGYWEARREMENDQRRLG